MPTTPTIRARDFPERARASAKAWFAAWLYSLSYSGFILQPV